MVVYIPLTKSQIHTGLVNKHTQSEAKEKKEMRDTIQVKANEMQHDG